MSTPSLPMASTVFDSILFRDAFGTPEMRAIFSDRALIARYIEVEVALAQGRGALRRDPGRGGRGDRARIDARAHRLRPHARGDRHRRLPDPAAGAPAGRRCAARPGRYVHWGATTQDIMDTAVVLQVRDALDIDRRRHRASCATILADLAQQAPRHADGRPHPPAAGAADDLRLQGRDLARDVRPPPAAAAQLRAARRWWSSSPAPPARWPRSATRASTCSRRWPRSSALGVPATTWHVARDGFAEAVNLLALVTGSLGKIALDIMIMASTEFGEVYEPFVKGRGASSTMPQKRNPISSELMLAAGEGGAPARRPDGRRDGAGLRARHRPVACRVDRDPGELHPHGRARCTRPSSRSAG